MPKVKRLFLQLIPTAIMQAFAVAGLAEIGAWQGVPNGQVRLLSHSAGQGQDTALGVEVALDEGWKIYWEYAGPVGQPTLIEATDLGSEQSADFFFPVPKRDRLQGFSSYGYEGKVIFPGVLSAGAQGGQVHLGLSICSQTQCIPYRTQLALPGDAVADDLLVRQKLRGAFAKVPVPVAGTPTLSLDRAAQEVRLSPPHAFAATDFLIAADLSAARDGFFLHPASLQTDGYLSAPYDIRQGSQELDFIRTPRLLVTGPEGAQIYDLRDAAAHRRLSKALALDPAVTNLLEAEVDSPAHEGAMALGATLIGAALFLFIGGFLLNLMPCVLPVLFLKMKAALMLDQADRLTSLRQSFGWTALGLVGTFLVLGLILVLVQRATGLQLTLGAWLQFPITTVILAALVVLFIANAFGWFEFVVPSSVTSLGIQQQGILGHILAGAVIALLGGACAGVLLAVALGLAFSQPPLIMVILLGIMGLGLALPYLLVALVPGAARIIPKPGPWMHWLKPAMGIGLGLTLAYLVFISTRQLQIGAVIALVLLSLLVLGALWASQKTAGLAGLALMVATLPFFSLPPDRVETARDYGAEIDTLVADGERVLVDVTAFWCATCQTNKLLVLDSQEVQKILKETGTQLFTINADMLAENVSAFMANQRRSSLPLNILFSPAQPEGEILPSILTKAAVREAIKRTL